MCEVNIKTKINMYFDRELSKEEEMLMFSSLAADDEAREYFKSLHILKETIAQTKIEFPFELEDSIFHSITKKRSEAQHTSIKNYPAAFAMMTIIFLVVVSIFYFNKTSEYKKELNTSIQQIKMQNETIKLLLNNMPETEVKANYKNEIIVNSL